MKKLLPTIMYAAFALAMASCSKDNGSDGRVTLEESSVKVSLARKDASIGINNGSGRYSPKIDCPGIADVSITTVDGKQALSIQAKNNGTATVVVIDLGTGYQAKCYLHVRDDIFYYTITDIKTAVDTDGEEAEVLSHMQTNAPYTVGSRYEFSPTSQTGGKWKVTGPLGSESVLSAGDYSVSEPEGAIPESYLLIWKQGMQLYDKQELALTDDMDNGRQTVRHLLCVDGSAPRLNVRTEHYRIYEDLTDDYKAAFPDAGIKGAVRMYVCSFATN